MTRFFRLASPSSDLRLLRAVERLGRAAILPSLLLAWAVAPAMATTITYNLADVTTQDGATVVGTVTYDTTLATVTGANITVTDATVGLPTPALLTYVYSYENEGGTVFQLSLCDNSACGFSAGIDTATALGAASVAVDPFPSAFGATSQIIGPNGFADSITGGTLVASSASPEPATAALGLLGIAGLIVGNRYRRGRRAVS